MSQGLGALLGATDAAYDAPWGGQGAFPRCHYCGTGHGGPHILIIDFNQSRNTNSARFGLSGGWRATLALDIPGPYTPTEARWRVTCMQFWRRAVGTAMTAAERLCLMGTSFIWGRAEYRLPQSDGEICL